MAVQGGAMLGHDTVYYIFVGLKHHLGTILRFWFGLVWADTQQTLGKLIFSAQLLSWL